MTGLCGWLAADVGEREPNELIASMASGLVGAGAEAPASRIEGPAALALVRPGSIGHLAAHDGVLAAIDGRVRWTAPELAEVHDRSGPAEALLQAYRRKGIALFEDLFGPFALAIVDTRAARSIIAIDRFGIHPLCYARDSQQGFLFGSTTDSLRAHPDLGATITPQAIFNFLYHYSCCGPETVYQEQRKLLPAQYAVFEKGEIETGFYWQVPYREAYGGRPEAHTEALLEVLRQAVRRAAEGTADEKLGAFLSGGLDSSTVVGLLSELSKPRSRAFTIGFQDQRYDESPFAQAATRHFGAEGFEYKLTPEDVVESLPRIVAAFDEPFGNTSAIPVYFCARLAKEHGVSLLLAGDGGDEIFAGNARYAAQKRFSLYEGIPQGLRSGLLEPLVLGLPGLGKLPVARKVRSYVERARVPLPDRLETYNFYANADLAEIFPADSLQQIDPEGPLHGLRAVYARSEGHATLHRMMHLDLKVALADNDLRKVGRMCDLAGVEVAYPFLDEDVVSFAAGVPEASLLKGFELRTFFKTALKDFLPEAALNKSKHGFGMPFREWTREDPGISALVRDSFEAFRARDLVRRDFLDRVLEEQAKPERTVYDGLSWDFLMLELWLRSRDLA